MTTAAALPLALPVLPPADIGWTYKVNPDQAQSIRSRETCPGGPA